MFLIYLFDDKSILIYRVDKMNENESKKPIKKFQIGCIQVAVWKNEKKDGENLKIFPSFTISKSYKDADEWKNVKSFSPTNYADLKLALDQAYLYMRTDFKEDAKNIQS